MLSRESLTVDCLEMDGWRPLLRKEKPNQDLRRVSMFRSIHIVLTFFCIVTFSVSGWAQSQTTTSIVGTVTDAFEAVVPGVHITVRNDDTGAERETETNSVGYYAVQA